MTLCWRSRHCHSISLGWKFFLPLTVGALVVIASVEATADATQLVSLLERHQITVMQATPATWHLLLEAHWTGSPQSENTVRRGGVVVGVGGAVAAALRLALEHVWADGGHRLVVWARN